MRSDLTERKRDFSIGEILSKHSEDFSTNSCHFNCFVMNCTLVLHSIRQIRRCHYWRNELIEEGTGGAVCPALAR